MVTEDFRREDSTHYLSGSTCDERAGNIRHWLKNNYDEPNDILYVLLIGNPHLTSFDVDTSVPMKKCSPNPNYPNNHPTDYFFAELTADWDKDRDGIYGEMGENASNGDEVDKYFEVYVGRIPYYVSINDLDHILQKTINYENSTDVQWRRNIFLPLVPFEPEEGVLSYELGEQIKKDHLEPEGISSVRIYDECYADAVPPPEHLRRNRYPATEWKQGTYGLVVWLTHGGSTYADGIIETPYTPRLNDDYPAATWQGSCGNSDPNNPDNLAYAILRNGGITTVGASGGANYWIPDATTGISVAVWEGWLMNTPKEWSRDKPVARLCITQKKKWTCGWGIITRSISTAIRQSWSCLNHPPLRFRQRMPFTVDPLIQVDLATAGLTLSRITRICLYGGLPHTKLTGLSFLLPGQGRYRRL